MILRFVYDLDYEGEPHLEDMTGGPCLIPGVESLEQATNILRRALHAESRRADSYWHGTCRHRSFQVSRALDPEEMAHDELDDAIARILAGEQQQ